MNPFIELIELHLIILLGSFVHFLCVLLLELLNEELWLTEYLSDDAYFEKVALRRLVVHTQIELGLLLGLL